MEAVAQFSFAVFTLITGGLIYQCLTPPNEFKVGNKSGPRDHVTTRGSLLFLITGRVGTVILSLGQAFCIAAYSDLDPGNHLNPTLLTWNVISVAALSITSAACLFRLQAYRSLGKDFTFDLRHPSRLNTSGIYAYVQHPSYTAAIMFIAGAGLWFLRSDGVMYYVLPSIVHRYYILWNYGMPLTVTFAIFLTLAVRVSDEELMLRQHFGKEWEIWHAKTARFIPGLF